MSPNNGGSGTRRKTPTDGEGIPPVKKPGSKNGDDAPMQVVLARGTMLKFILTISGTVIVGISAILGFYWRHHYKMTTHMGDGTIHLVSGERATLETKKEAQKNRAKLVTEVQKEVEYNHKFVQLEQNRKIQKLGDELKQAQREDLQKVLQEIRQTRRAVGRIPRSSRPRVTSPPSPP